MTPVYVIQNQHDQYLDKHREWTDGRDRRELYRTELKDEVINAVFELSSRDTELRAHYLECETDDNGHPIVTVSESPPAAQEPAGESETSDALETSRN